jgi:hypothetical protein
MEGAAAGLTKAQRGVLVPLLKKLGAYAEGRSGDDTDDD